MTSQQRALTRLHDLAMLWAAGYWRVSSGDVVNAACDTLVAGVQDAAAVEVAAVSLRRADEELREVLPEVARALGWRYDPGGGVSQTSGLRVLAAWVLAGHVPPRDLTLLAHLAFGHDDDAAGSLAGLDGKYEFAEHVGGGTEDIDAEVSVQARRLLEAIDP